MLQSAIKSVSGMNKALKAYTVYAMLAVMVVLSAVPASAQSLDLDVDVTPLFGMIETFFPVIFAILIIPGGIMIAMILGKFIINAMLSGFRGGEI